MYGLIGQQISNFAIKRPIGQGAMGAVFLGEDVKLQRPVAIKVLNSQFEGNENIAARFVQEAQRIAQWRHDNIIQVYFADTVDKMHYFVMEYVDGTDLDVLMTAYHDNDELMPHADVLQIGNAIASALDYAHEREVVHRDVKPSNILMSVNNRVILADFGLAKDLSKVTIGNAWGTPLYISPEQAMNPMEAVPQSDLYSLGVILYQLLTGEAPFKDATGFDLAEAHIKRPPPIPSRINPLLNEATNDVLLKALRKNPEDRYPTGQALMEALESALGDEAVLSDTRDKGTLILSDVAEPPPMKELSTMRLAELLAQKISERPAEAAFIPPPTKILDMPALQMNSDIANKGQEKKKGGLKSPQWQRYTVLASAFAVLIFTLVIGFGRGNDNTAAIMNVVAAANAPLADTSTTASVLSGDYTIAIYTYENKALQITNISESQQDFVLNSLQVGNDNKATFGWGWGVETLPYNACVRAVKKSKDMDTLADQQCTSTGPVLEMNPNEWNKDLDIYYLGDWVGSCPIEEEVEERLCTVTIQVE